MTTLIRNICRRVACNTFLLMLFCVAFALGGSRHTIFKRTKGNMSLPITCGLTALSMDILAVRYDTEYRCHYLGWEWGHVYDDVSTYYEKQRVFEEFKEPNTLEIPTMRLPIVFNDGAYIDMYIEFTILNAREIIRLVNTTEETLSVYDSVPETVMISLEVRNDGHLELRYFTWNGIWTRHKAMPTFPFTTGIVYKITFKALDNAYEVLVDDQQHVTYSFDVHPSEARQLLFSRYNMLLHKIEFVA